jgi:hypothetical protein
MKYLVIGGCSHTVGTGLGQAIKSKTKGMSQIEHRNFRVQNRWSRLLSDKLNLEEINLGKDGASNWQIYINVMSWILNNQEKINETLFVISWTYADRNYVRLAGDFLAGNELIYSSKSQFDKDSTIMYIPNELTHITRDNFYRWDDIWNEGIIKTSLLYMTGLTSFLSNQNLKYLHFHSDFFLPIGQKFSVSLNDHVLKKLSEYIAKYIDLFDTKNYIIDETYRRYCKSDMLIPPKYDFRDGHIGPDGQKSWADYLYQQLLGRGII